MGMTVNKKNIERGTKSLDQEILPYVFDEVDEKYLTFWCDHQLFGISILNVQQIVGIEKIIDVPEFPAYAKGIIHLRGSIIPVLDVRLRFHREEASYNERTCIIVTIMKDNLIGLIVDAVDEVTIIENETIAAPPKVLKNNPCRYITGFAKIKNKVVLILDVEKILNYDAIQFQLSKTDF